MGFALTGILFNTLGRHDLQEALFPFLFTVGVLTAWIAGRPLGWAVSAIYMLISGWGGLLLFDFQLFHGQDSFLWSLGQQETIGLTVVFSAYLLMAGLIGWLSGAVASWLVGRQYAMELRMKKLISAKLAGNILLVSFGLLTVFHVLVLLRVVPSNIVWGGQIGGLPNNLLTLEIVSLLMTVVFAMVIAAKTNYIKASKLKGVITIGVWIIFAYLILNTVGNLVSAVSFENLIFAPITLILAFLAFRLAIEK
jgi:hypothetical protein